MPALSSDQARINGAQPRMTELDLERLLMAIATNDRTNAELAVEFRKAPSTIYNLKVKYRDRIDDIRRKMTVDFTDLFIVRKAARLDDIQELRNLAWDQLRALLATNTLIDGRTGEVMAASVDAGQFKVFAELILKANRAVAEETGQLPQRVEGLGEQWTAKVLGVNGKGGIDYPAITQADRRWEAGAPERAAKRAQEKAAREQWHDEDHIRSIMRAGKSRRFATEYVQSERDRKDGFTPAECRQRARERRAAADYAEWVEALEVICEESVTQDLEGNPIRLDAAGLESERARIKEYWFPGDEPAHARVDAFFASWRYPDEDTEESEPVQILRMIVPDTTPTTADEAAEPDREPETSKADTAAEPDQVMQRLHADGWPNVG